MKKLITILFISIFYSCTSQAQEKATSVSISPIIEQTQENIDILNTLEQFLKSKNNDPASNRYWVEEDFSLFVYPYKGIYWIESSKLGNDFYQPSVMEILPTSNKKQKIVKIAYIGHDDGENKNFLRTIYNLVANVNFEGIKFSSYTKYITADWKVLEFPNIKYYISKKKDANNEEIKKQLEDIDFLNNFFECEPLNITYYSCINAVELFNIKGFDYNSDMYLSENGGLAEEGNIVYSANNSEFYTHEIVHLYTNKYLNKIPKVIDEGLATYLGGSGFNNYEWHKQAFKEYISDTTKDINYLKILANPYIRDYINDETPVPYIVGAILCEYVIKQKGKKYFFESINNLEKKGDIIELLKYWRMDLDSIQSIINKI